MSDLYGARRGRSHKHGTKTEQQAAEAVAPRTGNHRHRLLLFLYERGADGATAHEAWEATGGAYPHVASTRISELRAAGLAAYTERTRRTPSGQPAIVTEITEAGRLAVEQMKRSNAA